MSGDFRGSKPAFVPSVGGWGRKLCGSCNRWAVSKKDIISREEGGKQWNGNQHEVVMCGGERGGV